MSNTLSKLAAGDALLEQYNTRMGEYPTELNELIEGPQKDQLRRKWAEAIADQIDLVDGWNQPFVYILNPKGTRPPYDLYSIGSKGESRILSPRSQES